MEKEVDEKTKTRGQQMEDAVALLTSMVERNPEIMALGAMYPEFRTLIGNLFLDVASFRTPDLEEHELRECWTLAITNYMVLASETKEKTADRIKTASEILNEGAEWNGTKNT